MYQVDSEDAAFLLLEQPDNPAHISLVALYDQTPLQGAAVRFRQILQHIENRLNSTPVFYQKIRRVVADLDYPYWVDDGNFDLNYHVRHLALPKPGDWRQFCIQISRLHSRPLDDRRPLWELYVIEGLDNVAGLPSGSFALFFKIHHCAMDEFTALELFESLHETVPNPRQHEYPANHVGLLPAREPGATELLAQMIAGNLIRSARFTAQSLKNYRYLSRQALSLGMGTLKGLHAPRQSRQMRTQHFTAEPGPSRVFEGGFYPRDIVDRFCAQVPGAQLHHALMVICGEATRLYLEQKNVPDGRLLSARLLLNVRHAGAHALSGNRMTLRQTELFTGVIDLVERLYAVVGNGAAASDDELEQAGLAVRAPYETLPAPLLSLIGRWSRHEGRRQQDSGNFGIGIAANRGPQQAVYFMGARLIGLSSVSPLYQGCGLMYSASEYCDRLAITFTSDRDMLPDPVALRVCVDQALQRVVAVCKSSSSG